MKAAIFKGKGKIAVEEQPKPTIEEPTDAACVSYSLVYAVQIYGFIVVSAITRKA